MSHWLPKWIIATTIFANKQLVYVGVGKINCIVKRKLWQLNVSVQKPLECEAMNLMNTSPDPQADLDDVDLSKRQHLKYSFLIGHSNLIRFL